MSQSQRGRRRAPARQPAKQSSRSPAKRPNVDAGASGGETAIMVPQSEDTDLEQALDEAARPGDEAQAQEPAPTVIESENGPVDLPVGAPGHPVLEVVIDDDGSTTPGESDAGVGDAEGAVDEDRIEDTEGYLLGLVEAVLFVSESPVPLKELARACKVDQIRAGELVARLQAERRGRGVRLEQIAEGFALRTNPIYAEYLRAYLSQRPVRLSRAQLETLAIVAYRQPITRPEIDDIRGVDCGPVLKGLLERDLVRILGKKDEPGRPMLYGTTAHFLTFFNLRSLQELPTLKEFTELSQESRQEFERETGEDVSEALDSFSRQSGGQMSDTDPPPAPAESDSGLPAARESLENDGAKDEPFAADMVPGHEGAESADVSASDDEDEDDEDEDDEDEDDEDEDDEDEDDEDDTSPGDDDT